MEAWFVSRSRTWPSSSPMATREFAKQVSMIHSKSSTTYYSSLVCKMECFGLLASYSCKSELLLDEYGMLPFHLANLRYVRISQIYG